MQIPAVSEPGLSLSFPEMLLPDSLMLLGPAFSFAVSYFWRDSCPLPLLPSWVRCKVSLQGGAHLCCPSGAGEWGQLGLPPTLWPVCRWLLVGASPGDRRAGNTMAIQQTDEHMIFIKEQGWFPVCCSRNRGLTLCCSLGFSCCLLFLLMWRARVLPCDICSGILLVPGYRVVLSKISCRWGR